MFLVVMPVKETYATVHEIDMRKILAMEFNLNERYFDTNKDAFFEVCSDARRAGFLVYLHRMSWN